jgi:hypothetical protein
MFADIQSASLSGTTKFDKLLQLLQPAVRQLNMPFVAVAQPEK